MLDLVNSEFNGILDPDPTLQKKNTDPDPRFKDPDQRLRREGTLLFPGSECRHFSEYKLTSAHNDKWQTVEYRRGTNVKIL